MNEARALLNEERDHVLGKAELRTRTAGGIPLETYSNGSLLEPVAPGTRCYPLGLTYEKPTTICAPNANSRVLGGKVDANTAMRISFMKVSRGIDRPQV